MAIWLGEDTGLSVLAGTWMIGPGHYTIDNSLFLQTSDAPSTLSENNQRYNTNCTLAPAPINLVREAC